MRLKIASLAAVSLLLSAPATAQDPAPVFKPTGDWTADYGNDYCRLIRTFSDGKDQLSLALERTQPGEFTRLIFVGGALRPYRNAEEIGYAFLPAGTTAKTRYVRSETADGNQLVGFEPVALGAFAFVPGVAPPAYDPAKELETARAISEIVLDEGLTSPVRIETGSLRRPIAAMQACTDDLVKFWGLDVEAHKALSAAVFPNPVPQGVLPMGTIPFTEFGKLAGGANQVRLMVGADGKPTACTIYSPSLNEALNQRICAMLIDKATFQPARNAAGEAIPSFWMGPPLAFGPPPPPGFGR